MLLLSLAIICLDEFIKGAMDDVWIREMLECDPSTVMVERSPKRVPLLGPTGEPKAKNNTTSF